MIKTVHRVLNPQYPINATTTIEAGMAVSLNPTTGFVEKAFDAPSSFVLGLASDRNRASESFEWTNRVSDSGNETRASGMLSVYSLGEFYIDIDDANITTPNGTAIKGVVFSTATTNVGTILYIENTAANTNHAAAGQLGSATATNTRQIAVVIEAAGSQDAGIPGEFEPNSIEMVDSSAPRTWVKVKLLV